MRAIVLTLFPDMFPGPLGFSLAGKALHKGIWSLEALDIRRFALDKHKTVDDSPYGGGVGMVMKPEVIAAAVEAALWQMSDAGCQNPRIIYFTPRGMPMTQAMVQILVSGDRHQAKPLTSDICYLTSGLILLCGRFEGVDQRVVEHYNMLEVSLGDFVLSGGEIAAMALLDACVRLLSGVIGKEEALAEESFNIPSWPEFRRNSKAIQSGKLNHPRVCFTNPGDDDFTRLLEYPHYTRPSVWEGKAVPDVLLSGNHEEIRAWRLEQAKAITASRRPDLMKKE